MALTGQQRMILALFVAAAVMFAYSALFGPKREREPERRERPAPAETARAETGAPAPQPEKPPPPPPVKAPARVKTGARAVVTTPLYVAAFEDAGLVALQLAQYPPDEDQLLFARLNEEAAPPYLPLVSAGENARWEVDRRRLNVGPGKAGKLTFALTEEGRTLARAEYVFRGDDYVVAASVVAADEEQPVTLSLGSFVKEEGDPKDVHEISVDALVDTKKIRDKLGGGDEVKTYRGDIPWAALRSKYFILAAVAAQGGELTVTRAKNETIAATYLLKRGGDYEIYFGPKGYSRLKEFNVGLERTVDLGWSIIGVIAALMLRLMIILNDVVRNYGATIILFSLIIKLLTYWPTAAQLKSSQRMQEIQPILKQIREKYKGDAQRMNAEMMALYKKYKINPLGGCLPLLLQIPVFWGMFNALRNAIELKGAPFMFWISDLSQPDVLFKFPFTIPLVNINSLNVLPIIMTVVWLLQNRLTMPGKGGVKSEQQKLMAWLPLIFAFIFYNMPSGLVLYWTVNQLLTMGQMFIMRQSLRPMEAKD